MAGDRVEIPEYLTLQGLGALKMGQIRFRLSRASISHDSKASKPDLLPLLALAWLGLVEEDHDADPALLLKVKGWCGSLVSALEQDLSDAGIQKGPNKWSSIERLIRAEFREESSDDEDDEDDEDDDNDEDVEDTDEPNGEASGPLSKVAKFPTNAPKPMVMNLLLSLFYANIGTYAAEFAAAYPTCPVKTVARVLQVLDEVSAIKDRTHLTEICKEPRGDQYRLLSWLSSNFGSNITEATQASGLRIKGFPETVIQFVLANPVAGHNDLFNGHLRKAKGKSMLLFHGTTQRHLQSILRKGFTPAADIRFGAGLFMAENPQTSYYYAAKERGMKNHWKHWPKSPFEEWGILLACQVTGKGRPVRDDDPGTHVINKLDSIAIRYIFILPWGSIDEDLIRSAPARSVVKTEMEAAFKTIHEGIKDGNSAKDGGEEVVEPEVDQGSDEGEVQIVESGDYDYDEDEM
ncbi:uncharacterized protein RCO7_01365 [Rhynchosporium graminicola]|uniref:PARP catalytic domain-containing protein n=1 Tax=Rhynchosporium graminicola TaxID=2792576 RepID=A0A1E1JZ43_9HELO|nr:uncharacterized protein RCO7_01365 [Rhynchosporium commune]